MDLNGHRLKKEDWYLGACPSCDAYVENKTRQIEKAAKALEPDGIFLGFMRFPGFWETWLPEVKRENLRDCCFCDYCVDKFQRWSGIRVPEPKNSRGRWIMDNVPGEYACWKALRLRDIIVNVRECTDGKIKIMLNTLPFDSSRFGNVRAGLSYRYARGLGAGTGHWAGRD